MVNNDESYKIICPEDGYLFDTHTEIQNEYIERIEKNGTENAIKWLKELDNDEDFSYPATLCFRWEGEPAHYIFELSKNEDFSGAYKIECLAPFCEITNLEIGQKYFWKINGKNTHYFFTKDNSFRFLKIDGVINVRDLGGNKIKQGIIYRGSDIYTDYKISQEGKKIFADLLKIKTEIELRKEAGDQKASVAGETVKFKYLPYRPYKEIFEEENRMAVCEIMQFLSDENNYPVYIHCLGGADRTGMIAIFLRALAGETDEMIHLDFELTGLSNYYGGAFEGVTPNQGFRSRSRNGDYYIEFLNILDTYAPNESLSKKVRMFLSDCGVSEECMRKITEIIKIEE